MHRKFVISDPHLGHTNMALRRGFNSAEEHDNYIISKWNGVVKKNDTVYILGDIAMENSRYYYKLALLNGIKKTILGNHESPQHILELLKYVNSVCSSYTEKNCILTHIPIHPIEMSRYRKNIHGHVHENTIDDNRYVNVSCEVIDYTPQLLNNYI
jgi:calcineurin-like phosphoesterase family protein